MLFLSGTHITDAGCAALAAALDSNMLPALTHLYFLAAIPASAAAKAAVRRVGLRGITESGFW